MIECNDEPKYKKKSKAKGQPRSKHKHEYETVLLTKHFTTHNIKTGLQEDHIAQHPTKVCTICGRIDYIDWYPSYYIHKVIDGLPFIANERDLSDKALLLPKWHCNFFDKFAVKDED